MNPFVVLAALIVVAGAVAAATQRDARLAGLGLAVVLIGSAFVLAPPPTLTAMAFRVVAGVLAAFVVRIAVRHAHEAAGSPLGFRAPTFAAVGAMAAGLGVTPLVVHRSGPEAAVAAGLAVLVLAAPQLVIARAPFRVGIGIVLAACGALMLRAALGGTPSAFEEIAEGTLLVALAVAMTVAVAVAERPRPEGDEALEAELAAHDARRGALRIARAAAAPVLGSRPHR